MFLYACVTVSSQSPAAADTPQWIPAQLSVTGNSDEPSSFIGLTLIELIGRFGVPTSVYAARGMEMWQDDVVFMYEAGDFYVYKDHVWQVSLKSAYGIRLGDSRAAVTRALRWPTQSYGDSTLCVLSGLAWPLTLRIDYVNAAVSAIRIYRSDF
ncbi:MAG: hypothetical protein LBS86_06340 [Treponema sp.]|nr:hypothetical protein [Treponema sp.]